MKKLMLAILAQLVGLSVWAAQEPSPINPRTVFEVSGVTVVSPGEPGWQLVKQDKKEILFRKQDKDRMCLARVTITEAKSFGTVKDMLADLEAQKEEELQKTYIADHLHFNHVNTKGGLCLHYSGIVGIKDPPSSFSHLNFEGGFCPYQGNWNTLVEIEFSERSNSRGLTEDQLSLANEFFDGVGQSKTPAR